ncbi:BON domain-containing protein [Psychrobacter sp. 16-MNA-CIBAN-0192]|uniref:BON domain-containing protein n=1 Tax=Psychrobacter sp. 16-MNA-CIBAN-0192 TaxID=3140448 RepID=UPI00331FF42C
MTRMHSLTSSITPRRAMIGVLITACLISTGCATNYLTNSTEGTYGVPVTERTIPQRLLDRSIEHTAKVNIYGLQENLQQDSRISINSFYSEVLLLGEVPSEDIKTQSEKVLGSMPDVRRVYNELKVSVSKGYSSTVHDGYITTKLLARVTANNGIKASQIKIVTNDGVVYVMGRMTPSQQSLLIDMANNTVGITELVLLTTLMNEYGAPIDEADIMSETSPPAS